MVKIAILGFGTVGSGVYEVINKNTAGITKKAGEEIKIKYILDIRDFPEHPEAGLFTKKFEDILKDPEVCVVVEAMGGLHPAYEFTKEALLAGKHVVTSNKELVATHGTEFLSIAKKNDINYLFEASVGGGIPIIRPLNQCLAANDISEIWGILNGTTNYILTQMLHVGKSFEDALQDAQKKGYAEKNPEADVEGMDACRKIAILGSLILGKKVDSEKIYTEGITKVTPDDAIFAESLGYVIKLIAMCRQEKGKIFARVCPMLMPKQHPLAGIEDVFNGILVLGDATGEVMFYGRGAGKLPTASAVVADVIDAARNIDRNNRYMWYDTNENVMLDIKDESCAFFARVLAKDAVDAKSVIQKILGECDFLASKKNSGEFAFITKEINEAEFMKIKEKISNLDSVDEILSLIRVYRN